MKASAKSAVRVLVVAAVMAAAVPMSASRQVQMWGEIDSLQVQHIGGIRTAMLGGWFVANGVRPTVYVAVDGANTGAYVARSSRHDVAEIVNATWSGWTADDGVARPCDFSDTWGMPCPACVGAISYFMMPEGRHQVSLCGHPAAVDIYSPPVPLCRDVWVDEVGQVFREKPKGWQ